MYRASATLEILDEVNVRFRRLDADTLKVCSGLLAYYVNGYRFSEKFALGWWDGKIRLFNAESGKTFLNLIDTVLPLIERNYDLDLIDYRADYSEQVTLIKPVAEDYFAEYRMVDKATDIEGPVILRAHQLDAINTCIEHGTGLFEIATGGGKTLCCAVLAKVYSAVGNVVVIVPSSDLILQTRGKFRAVGLDCGIWYGEEKERKPITVSTWQSLNNYADELFEGVLTVIVDEVQGAKAKVLGEILGGPGRNVPFRFGCTGTLPKEDLSRQQIISVVGQPRTKATPRDLQNLGLLSQAEVHQVMLNDRANRSYIRAVGGTKAKDGHAEWNDELAWFANETRRMEWIATFLRAIAEQGNTLVVCERMVLIDAFRALLPEAIVITGEDSAKTVRAPAWERFSKMDNGILICTSGIGSVGIDIPSIMNVVPFELGKAAIKIMQTMGRGLRPIPGKLLMLYDIYGNAKLSKKHANERRKAFEEYGQIVHHTEADYL
jgi:superfamily II DNA or RNA helicase